MVFGAITGLFSSGLNLFKSPLSRQRSPRLGINPAFDEDELSIAPRRSDVPTVSTLARPAGFETFLEQAERLRRS